MINPIQMIHVLKVTPVYFSRAVSCPVPPRPRQCNYFSGRSSTPNVEDLPDLADLPDLVIPDVDSCTGNDTVLYTIYWRNCTVAMLSDVFNNLEILNTPLILVIMLLQDNNIFKKLTSGIMDSLTGFQDNLVQSWWPDFPTGVTGHVGGTSV